MRGRQCNQARRALLQRSAEVAGLLAVIVVTGNSEPATAKAAKSEFMYQDHPHDGNRCGQCKFFSVAGPDSEVGSCSIVAGAISRQGWCAAFVRSVHG